MSDKAKGILQDLLESGRKRPSKADLDAFIELTKAEVDDALVLITAARNLLDRIDHDLSHLEELA